MDSDGESDTGSDGISPIIGVVLMVALAVVALLAIFTLGYALANPTIDGPQYLDATTTDGHTTISVQSVDGLKYATVDADTFEGCTHANSRGTCTLFAGDSVVVPQPKDRITVTVVTETYPSGVIAYQNGEWRDSVFS